MDQRVLFFHFQSREHQNKFGMPHHHFRQRGVGALRANLANLKCIRDFSLNTPPCSDKNMPLFRGSLD